MEVDVRINRFERQAKLVNLIKQKKAKATPHLGNEVVMIWLDKHKALISQQNDNRDKLNFFKKAARCKGFPLKPDFSSYVECPEDIDKLNISNEDKARTRQTVDTKLKIRESASPVNPPSSASRNSAFSRRLASRKVPDIELSSTSRKSDIIRNLASRDTTNRDLPSTDSDSPIKISSDSSDMDTIQSVPDILTDAKNRYLRQSLSKINLQPSEKQFPRDIRKRMYPSATDSDSNNKNSSDTSEYESHLRSGQLHPTTGALQLGHNLEVLKRKPIDRQRLLSLRERE